jgi:hypothetical protein
MTVPSTRLEITSENGILKTVKINGNELTTATSLKLNVTAIDMPRVTIGFDAYDSIIDLVTDVEGDTTELKAFIKEAMQDTLQEDQLADWVSEDVANALWECYITPFLNPRTLNFDHEVDETS